MEERNRDTLYLDLIDYVKGYQPEIKLSEYKVGKFLTRFDIPDEGDVVMVGSKREWVLFYGMILEHLNL